MTFGVRDLQKVRVFYGALGWESLSEGDEFTRFQTGGATLALFSLDLLAEEADMQPPKSTERFSGFTCAFLVQEDVMVDAAIEMVRRPGAACLRSWSRANGAVVQATSPTPKATSANWPGCRALLSKPGAD